MYEKLRKVQDFDLKNKTVIVRSNFDVPLKDGEVADNTRIQASLKTIEYLADQNCKVIVISHLGRPNGETVDELSLMPVRFELGRLLNRSVKFAHINASSNSIKFMEHGEILMLENLRFNKGEESEDKTERAEFIKPLVELGDFYVNDCFGLYREHASVYDLALAIPSAAGFSIQKEVESLNYLKDKPAKPFVTIIGGAKADTKIPVIKALIDKIDVMLVGGAIAYTFLKAQGVNIGDSKFEEEKLKEAKDILNLAKKNKVEVVLPLDHIIGDEFEENTKSSVTETNEIPKGKVGLDIGPKTLTKFREVIETAKTIVWAGPMGVFEWEKFTNGTESVGQYIALSSPKDSFKVAGGSETTMAINTLRIKQKKFDHISVGGGMMIKYIANNGKDSFKVLDILAGEQKIAE